MMYNSGDISKETDKVVGYGSWFLYTDSKNEYIEKYYSKYILRIVKNLSMLVNFVHKLAFCLTMGIDYGF